MASLDEVYRARRGTKNEQVENFLTACTGVVLEDQGAARAFLALFGKAVPEGATVKSDCQVPVFDSRTGAPVGIADLVLSWRDGESRSAVVVEAKVDDALTEEQPQRYADALGDGTEVVVLTPSKADAATWPDHATWQAWSDALAGLDGVLARELRAHLDRLSLATEETLSVAALRAQRGDGELIHNLNRDARLWVRRMVPSGAVRRAVPGVGNDDKWDAEDPAGAWFEWSKKKRQELDAPYRGLGVRFEVEGDDLVVVVSVLPLARARKAWLMSDMVPWMAVPRSDWLEARVGVVAGGEARFADATVSMLHRARGLLRAVGSMPGAPGLWKKVRRPSRTGMVGAVSVSQAVAALTRFRPSQRTAELMKSAWLDAAHRAVKKGEVPVRAVYRPGSFFYVENERGSLVAQLGVNMRLHKKRAARTWVWFSKSSRAAAFCARMKERGWEPRSRVYKGDQREVLCWPPVADDAHLGRDEAEAWGREVGGVLAEVVKA